jgi:hypothetical protein
MLLVTLVFVLTTRGIALDLSATGRTGLRADHSSPISSPPLKRSTSMSLGQNLRSVSERFAKSTNKSKRTGEVMQHFDTISDSIQSAPATPAGLPRAWQINSSSPLGEYNPMSPDESSAEDEHCSIDGPSSSRRIEDDEIGNEFLIMGDRYLTPLSNLEE